MTSNETIVNCCSNPNFGCRGLLSSDAVEDKNTSLKWFQWKLFSEFHWISIRPDRTGIEWNDFIEIFPEMNDTFKYLLSFFLIEAILPSAWLKPDHPTTRFTTLTGLRSQVNSDHPNQSAIFIIEILIICKWSPESRSSVSKLSSRMPYKNRIS